MALRRATKPRQSLQHGIAARNEAPTKFAAGDRDVEPAATTLRGVFTPHKRLPQGLQQLSLERDNARQSFRT
jgi:hypothetical protein